MGPEPAAARAAPCFGGSARAHLVTAPGHRPGHRPAHHPNPTRGFRPWQGGQQGLGGGDRTVERHPHLHWCSSDRAVPYAAWCPTRPRSPRAELRCRRPRSWRDGGDGAVPMVGLGRQRLTSATNPSRSRRCQGRFGAARRDGRGRAVALRLARGRRPSVTSTTSPAGSWLPGRPPGETPWRDPLLARGTQVVRARRPRGPAPQARDGRSRKSRFLVRRRQPGDRRSEGRTRCPNGTQDEPRPAVAAPRGRAAAHSRRHTALYLPTVVASKLHVSPPAAARPAHGVVAQSEYGRGPHKVATLFGAPS